MSGTKTYYLPNSDVEVKVDFTIQYGDPRFDFACIGDQTIDTELMFVKFGEKIISLSTYFQNKLDNDYEEIMDGERANAADDRCNQNMAEAAE